MAEAKESGAKQEDFLALLKGYNPPQKSAYARDVLAGRWRILTDQPLIDFESPFARAYAVRDPEAPDAKLYALVFDNTVPLRQKNISVLREYRHPNLASLLECGKA